MSTESIEQISDLIREHFNFLFKNGFEIVNSTIEKDPIFYIVLDGKFRIRIGRTLDGEVYVDFALLNTPVHSWKEWCSLRLVLYYLSNKSIFLESVPVTIVGDIQMERLAKFVSDNFQQIFELFTGSQFSFFYENKNSLYQELLEIEAKLIRQEKKSS